jgi:hypothetical protein
VPNEILQLLGQNQGQPRRHGHELPIYRKTPATLKETTTVALRNLKEGLSCSCLPPYHPQNTIAKLIETIVARRLTDAGREAPAPPMEQMGGRKGRSTITAVRLLIDVIQTV